MLFLVPLCQQQKRKLRLYISNTFNPARPDADDSDGSIASWELRVEGKLLDDVSLVYVKYMDSELTRLTSNEKFHVSVSVMLICRKAQEIAEIIIFPFRIKV